MNLIAKYKIGHTKVFDITKLTVKAEWSNDWGNLSTLKKNIEQNGLLYPIIIEKWNIDRWQGYVDQKRNMGREIIPAHIFKKSYHLVVRIGNQRVKIAKELGYVGIEGCIIDNEKHLRSMVKQIKSQNELIRNQDFNKLF